MGFRQPKELRVEQRLRRIEAQLHDILALLEQPLIEHQTANLHSDVALREACREFEAEQQDIQISLSQIPAANDSHK